MSHETAETQATTPFVPTPSVTTPPVATASPDTTTFQGTGPGGEAPFAGLYDHNVEIKPTARGGVTGMEVAAERKSGYKAKTGFTQSTKGPGFAVGGSRKKGDITRGVGMTSSSEGTVFSVERERKIAEGKTATHGATYNATTGELGGSYKRASGEGANARSVGVDAAISKDSAKAKLRLGRGDNGGSLGAGIKATYGLPTMLPDGRWECVYDTTMDASVGGNTKHATAGVEGARSSGGKRIFATKEAAEDFAKGNGRALSNDPMDLQPGETMSRSQSGKIKVGGEASFGGGAALGGGVSGGLSTSETVSRIDNDTVQIVVSHGKDGGINGSAGAGPVSAGVGYERGSADDKIYRFDVSTPEGRAALKSYRETGSAPLSCLVGQGHADTSGFSRSVNLGLLGAGTGGKVTERTDQDLEGNTAHTYTGIRTKSASLVGAGQHSAVASLTSGPLGTDIAASVKSSDGRSSMEELAEATGTRAQGTAGAGSATSSGTWTVESHMSDEQLAVFCDKVAMKRDHYPDAIFAPLVSLSGDGKSLQEELRKCKSGDECRAAVARFVASAGGKGAAWIRQIGGIQDYDVKLENDENFTGTLGREQLDAQLLELYRKAQAGTADPDVIKKDLAFLNKRMAAISDPKRYTDLPADVRAHEIEALKGHIRGFEKVSKIAAAKPRK